MHPVLAVGSLELSSYVLMLSLGGALGFWLTFREASRTRADAVVMIRLAAIAFLAGLVGARAFSVLVYRRLYADEPWWSFLAFWDRGGMALYGGLALALAVGLVYIRLSGLDKWEASDLLVVAWLPFLVFVRVGCFLNGCCYGRPTTNPLGMVAGGSPNALNFGVPSHPAQLYDAAATLAIFALVWALRTRRRFVGQLTVTFLALHSSFRFFHETLRGDPRLTWRLGSFGAVNFNQVVSVALLAFALGAYVVLRQRENAPVATPD